MEGVDMEAGAGVSVSIGVSVGMVDGNNER